MRREFAGALAIAALAAVACWPAFVSHRTDAAVAASEPIEEKVSGTEIGDGL